MAFRINLSSAMLCVLSIHSLSVIACPNKNTSAPCAPANLYPVSGNQIQAVISLQQQALRSASDILPWQALAPLKSDEFTVSSLGALRDKEDSIIASVDQIPDDKKKVVLYFPGEKIGYRVDLSIYESLLKEKKITLIGTRFIAMLPSQASQIKTSVMRGWSTRSIQLQVIGDNQFELALKN